MVLAADTVVTIHGNVALAFLLYCLFMTVWGIFLFVRGEPPSGGYLGALALTEGLALVQGLIGLLVYGQGHRAHDGLHYLYGLVAVLTLPAAFVYADRGTSRRASLILGCTSLFLVGIALRSMVTGKV